MKKLLFFALTLFSVSVYAQIGSTPQFSEFNLKPKSSPISTNEGTFWFDNTCHCLKVRQNSAWVPLVVATSTIAGATDANVSSPSNLQVLQYQTSDNKWHNATITTTSTIAGATDANISSTANNQFLRYKTSDSKWHNDSFVAGTDFISPSGSETLTNKTISGSNNTITNIGPTSGGTGLSSYTAGDLIYASATNTLSKLGIGTRGQVFQVSSGGNGAWQNTTGDISVQTLTDASTITWNVTNGVNAKITIGSTGRTLSISNPVAGQVYVINVIQDGTGSRTITTWPTGTIWGDSGTSPTLTTTANAKDVVVFYYDGTNFFGSFKLDYK
jgi:hypothetical protein